jgi:hypothetical protein
VRVEGRRVPGGADRSRTRMVSGSIADSTETVLVTVSKPASEMVSDGGWLDANDPQALLGRDTQPHGALRNLGSLRIG